MKKRTKGLIILAAVLVVAIAATLILSSYNKKQEELAAAADESVKLFQTESAVAEFSYELGGEKLASRTGNIILLNDVFDEAVAKAKAIIEEKNADLADKDGVSEAVGIGAVIFGALSNSRIKDTDFTWEGALSFEGNTGPYVQYTYARAASVLRKAEGDMGCDGDYTPNEDEINLIKQLCLFPERVNAACVDNEPSYISRFMLDTCSAFNKFYHNCSVLRESGATRKFRLKLTAATKQILGVSLDLLGMRRTEEI